MNSKVKKDQETQCLKDIKGLEKQILDLKIKKRELEIEFGQDYDLYKFPNDDAKKAYINNYAGESIKNIDQQINKIKQKIEKKNELLNSVKYEAPGSLKKTQSSFSLLKDKAPGSLKKTQSSFSLLKDKAPGSLKKTQSSFSLLSLFQEPKRLFSISSNSLSKPLGSASKKNSSGRILGSTTSLNKTSGSSSKKTTGPILTSKTIDSRLMSPTSPVSNISRFAKRI